MRAAALVALGFLLVLWLMTVTGPEGPQNAAGAAAGDTNAGVAFADRIGLRRARVDGRTTGGPIQARSGTVTRPDLADQPAPRKPDAGIWAAPAEFAPSDPIR